MHVAHPFAVAARGTHSGRRRAGLFVAEQMFPRHGPGIADGADGELTVPATAAQKNRAAIVQRAHQREAGDGMPKDRPVAGFIEQTPDHQARMVAIAPDHLGRGAIKPFGHLG